MTWQPSLYDDFVRMAKDGSPHNRGYRLEGLVRALFQTAHYRVLRNAGMARPRQTDLTATNGRETYLIETKWENKAIDIDTVDGLRARLSRTHSAVIGVLISISGFTPSAIEDVETRRHQPILLIDKEELTGLLSWPRGLAPTLHKKYRHMLEHGTVRIGGSAATVGRSKRSRHDWPNPYHEFVLPDGTRTPWLRCRGGYQQFVFAHELTDIDSQRTPGVGVSLDLALGVISQGDLITVFGELLGQGWMTGGASWNIQQSGINWHGIGPGNFVQALLEWKHRYEGLDDLHHTENVCYHDTIDEVFYTVTAGIRADGNRTVYHCELSFQLAGIPVEPAPFQHLCQSLGVEEAVVFRPRTEEAITYNRVGPKGGVILHPIAQVMETEMRMPWASLAVEGDHFAVGGAEDALPSYQPMVGGIVVANPFTRDAGTAPPEEWPRDLEYSELLLCRLRSYHGLDHPVGPYRLWAYQYARTGDASVICPVAEWDDPPGKKRLRSRRVTQASREGASSSSTVGRVEFYVDDPGEPNLLPGEG